MAVPGRPALSRARRRPGSVVPGAGGIPIQRRAELLSKALVHTLIDTLRLGGAPDPELAGRWRRLAPRGLTELVGYEGGAEWLFRRLRASGTLDALPGNVSQRLRTQAFEAAALRMRVAEEAAAVIGLLGSEGIPVILIKGVARCALAHRYPYLDARVTRDVDLLLPQATIHTAHELLQARGYVPTRMRDGWEPEHHHLQALRNERNVAVELHESNSVRVPAEVAWTRATEMSEELEWAGLRVRVPCPTEIAWSAIAHGLADGIRGFRLERFLEVAALVAGGAAVDWNTIRRRRESGEAGGEAALVLGWVNAALAFVDPPLRPAGLAGGGVDLTGLMEWRLLILRARRRLGRAFTDRLLEEGPRTLLGLPLREAPPDASWPRRLRRRTAGQASRVLFRAWRALAV